MGSDTMVLVFWMLSFKPTFLLSCFTFIKRHISYLLSAISVVLSVYLRLLKFLPAILIPAFASSSAAFLMMYSAHELNKKGDNMLSTNSHVLRIQIKIKKEEKLSVLKKMSWLLSVYEKENLRMCKWKISFLSFFLSSFLPPSFSPSLLLTFLAFIKTMIHK